MGQPTLRVRPAHQPGSTDVAAPGARPSPRTTPWLVAAVAVGVVLRWWSLGSRLTGFDEAYAAMVSRRSLPGLFGYLRHHDPHPPLDYLLRAPFVQGGYDLLALRAPSAVFSCAALVLFARWMRTRGWFGVLATALMAVSGFELFFGRQARMYALLELLGVAGAMLLDRWLRSPAPWHAFAVAGLVFVGALDHVSMLLFAPGLLVAAGLRHDRDAWRWRIGVVGGLAAWAAVWGVSFLDQRVADAAGWVPTTSPTTVRAALGRLVVFTSGSELLGVVLLVVGLWCLSRRDPALARVAVYWFVVPVAIAIVLGLTNHLMIERMFTLGAWAVFPALAAIPSVLAVRGRVFGGVAAALVVLVVLPGGIGVLREQWQADAFTRDLRAASVPGDVVAIVPGWWGPLTEYGVGVASGPMEPVSVPGLDDVDAFRIAGAPPTGRVWLAVRSTRPPLLDDLPRCGPTSDDGVFRVTCVEVPGIEDRPDR